LKLECDSADRDGAGDDACQIRSLSQVFDDDGDHREERAVRSADKEDSCERHSEL